MFADLKEWAVNVLGLSAVGKLASERLASEVSRTLSITAISAVNQESVLECWQIKDPFVTSQQDGLAGASVLQFGSANTSLMTVPPCFDAGLQWAPSFQYLVWLSGEAVISTPGVPNSQPARIKGGQGTGSIIFAADTADVSTAGHHTEYPGDVETVAVSIKVSEVPEHVLLNAGPCSWHKTNDVADLKGHTEVKIEL